MTEHLTFRLRQIFLTFLIMAVLPLFSLAALQAASPIGKLNPVPVGDQQTIIHASLGKDVGAGPYSSLTLSQPQVLIVHMQTDYAGAIGIEWRVTRLDATPVIKLPQGSFVSASKAQLKLDLFQFFPKSPPQTGATYLVWARALKKGTSRSPLHGGYEPLGHWSEPLVLNYRQVAAAPTLFDETARYRRMRIVMDNIEMIDEQHGDGKEEFRIMGTAQEFRINKVAPGTEPVKGLPEYFIGAVGNKRSFGPISKNLKPPKGKAKFNVAFNSSAAVKLGPTKEAILNFDFGNAGNFNYRRYVFALSVMERDGGGEIQEWYDGFKNAWEALESVESGVFDQAAFEKKALKLKTEMEREMARILKDALWQSVSSDPYSLVIKIGLTLISVGVDAAIVAEKDDYYGTRSTSIDVLSNRIDLIHLLPGKKLNTDEGPVYRLKPKTWQFFGPPPPNAATGEDGIVNITFFIEFYDRLN